MGRPDCWVAGRDAREASGNGDMRLPQRFKKGIDMFSCYVVCQLPASRDVTTTGLYRFVWDVRISWHASIRIV